MRLSYASVSFIMPVVMYCIIGSKNARETLVAALDAHLEVEAVVIIPLWKLLLQVSHLKFE